MPKASPIQVSFAAGELAPEIDGRIDLEEYAIGTKRCENFIPTIQGPAVRRAGTRYVNPVKDQADRTWLLRFEFNVEQAYILEFGDLYIRFYLNHGQLLSGMSAYEIVSPHQASDLADADGNFLLNFEQSGDVIYITHALSNFAVYKLSRLGATNWTMTEVSFTGGPFEDINPDETVKVSASAVTGSVTLYALQTNFFSTQDWGSLFQLEQPLTDSTKMWEPAKVVSANDIRKSDGKYYQALNGATTGTVRPTHTEGAVFDGDAGVQWQYLHAGRGYVRIISTTSPLLTSVNVTNAVSSTGAPGGKVRLTVTGHPFTTGMASAVAGVGGTTEANGSWFVTVIDPNTIDLEGSNFQNAYTAGGTASTIVGSEAQCTVIDRLPDGVVGPAGNTTRWARGSWSDRFGYPSHVTFFKERLTFIRSGDRRVWLSVVADFENFAARDKSGQVVDDQAIRVDIVGRQVNRIQWVIPAEVLMVGSAGGEHIIRELTADRPLSPSNITSVQISEYGSAPVAPVRVGNSILFVQRAGRKVRELAFSPDGASADGYGSIDLAILAQHFLPRGKYLTQIKFQQEPHSVVWAVRNDGLLIGIRYNSNRKAVAWFRAPIGGNAVVEAIETIPAPDGDRDELWMVVRRTIDGATTRYVEWMEYEWTSADVIANRFYVDSGATYSGAPATTISGLSHLNGQVVDVLADGAAHPQRTVVAGAITLERAASVVQVGLPCIAKLQTMRIEAGAGDGTAQGKIKRINDLTIRFLDTLGGMVGPDEDNLDTINFRMGSDPMNAPPPAFTGDQDRIAFNSGYELNGHIWYVNDQPLPATVVAFMPKLHTQDR